MELVDVTEQGVNEITDLGRWSEWSMATWPRLVRLLFRVEPDVAFGNRRNLLCDLRLAIGAKVLEKPNAVYLQRQDSRSLNIVLASDVHVATRWDRIEEDVGRHFSRRQVGDLSQLSDLLVFSRDHVFSSDCFLDSFVNPNRNVLSLVRQVNRLHDRGEVDMLFLTGDLVDYKFHVPREHLDGAHFENTEWSLLKQILLGETILSERLCVPMLTSTGNHDYRLFPYRLRTYGIQHCAIPYELTIEYLRRSGQYDRWKYRFADLDAIRVERGPDRHSLDHYYREFNPFVDFTIASAGVRFVFLDTGPDAFSNLRFLLSKRWRRFLSVVARGFAKPVSSGLSDEQIDFLRKSVGTDEQSKTHIVVMHAPVLNPAAIESGEAAGPSSGTQTEINTQAPIAWESERNRLAFERDLSASRLDEGTVFRNQLALLGILQNLKTPSMILSGHSHRRLGLVACLESDRLVVRSLSGRHDFARSRETGVLLLQTPALGHIKRHMLVGGVPSYRILTAVEGNIEETEVVPLGEQPFNYPLFDWHVTRLADEERVEFRSVEAGPDRQGSHRLLHKIVCWLRFDITPKDFTKRNALNITPVLLDPVLAAADCRATESGAHVSFVIRDVPVFAISLRRRPKGLPVSFVFESFEACAGRFVSLGLRRHFRDLS